MLTFAGFFEVLPAFPAGKGAGAAFFPCFGGCHGEKKIISEYIH
jgi:hypothetical protein